MTISQQGRIPLIVGGLAFAGLALKAEAVLGTLPIVPVVNNDTIVGVWESVTHEGPTIMRLDIRKTGPSYVAFAVGRSGLPDAAVYQVRELKVSDGRVKLTADDLTDKSSYSLVVTASGRAGAGEGVMDATTVLRDRKANRALRQWRGAFVMSKHGYIRELTQLSAAAETQIQIATSVRASP
jgi:hypothetical protein